MSSWEMPTSIKSSWKDKQPIAISPQWTLRKAESDQPAFLKWISSESKKLSGLPVQEEEEKEPLNVGKIIMSETPDV